MLLLARMLLRDEEDSRDVVSEVFADIMGRDFAGRAPLTVGYLLTCVRNKCLNQLRHYTVVERVRRLLPTEEVAGDNVLTTDEAQLARLWSMVDAELTPQTARVVKLRFEAQMTYQEIARQLGISTVAVYKHLAQAVRVLRQRFHPDVPM